MFAPPAVVAMDLEGVLIPEVWIAFAEKTGIEKLRLTTRDVPDYDKLMRGRLELLREHDLTLKDIQNVIGEMAPLPGAKEYLDWLRAATQTIILSDTFYEFADPFMRKLGRPTLFCHSLETDADGAVVGYRLRIDDGKREAVGALKRLGFRALAIGDSYNDTAMLGAADRGILFRPPPNVIDEFPQYPVATEYDDLKDLVRAFLAND
jgi:phosphoserine/homoserine phosphotransferase